MLSLAVILKAFSIGLLLICMPGAALFSILQTSISRGFKAGLFLAIGISISDILLVALCFVGIANLMIDNETATFVMGLIGGVILIGYGIYTFLNKKTDLNPYRRKNTDLEQRVEAKTSKYKMLQYTFKGFIFNFTNPFVWLLWIGVVPMSGNSVKEQSIFLLLILLCTFSGDALKSFFANKIKQILTPKVIYWVNRIVGLVFLALGLVLIIRSYILYA